MYACLCACAHICTNVQLDSQAPPARKKERGQPGKTHHVNIVIL